MTSSSQNRGYRELAELLRQEWLTDWRGGMKLPAYRELTARLGTTRATLQRAMDYLVARGYVVTRPTVGAFLASRPPGESRIGIVFPGHPEEVAHVWTWSRQYLAILQAAERLESNGDRWRYCFYMGVSDQPRSRGLRRLLDDVEDGSLAGLVFAYTPHDIAHLSLVAEPPLPVVHLNRKSLLPGLFAHFDSDRWLSEALGYARSRQRQRVAVLTTTKAEPDELAAAMQAQTGVTPPREWMQAASPYEPRWLPNLLRAMLRPVHGEAPEALLVTDDHFLQPVVDTLAASGVHVPSDLLVLGHWNFPLAYEGRLPVELLGFDAVGWLQLATRLIAEHPGAPAGRYVETLPPRSDILIRRKLQWYGFKVGGR